MLGIRLKDQKTSERIRQNTKVLDVAERMERLKSKWGGHWVRRVDEPGRQLGGAPKQLTGTQDAENEVER